MGSITCQGSRGRRTLSGHAALPHTKVEVLMNKYTYCEKTTLYLTKIQNLF